MKIRILLTTLLSILVPLAPISNASAAPHLPQGNPHKQVCSAQRPGTADCTAHVVLTPDGAKPLASATYSSGYRPADLVSAYKLPALPTGAFTPNGQTVAIVDAYDNPNAAADLVAYRQQFNLPLCATSNPSPSVADLTSCFFTQLNQNGQASPMPAGNTGWGQEIALDVDMVSAACPSCKILLVEANSNSYTDLGTAVNTAAQLGANAISNSYGGKEFSSETTSTYAPYFNHPGIAITVSSGDNGYGVQFPAASPYVTAVGGTSLTQASNARGWSEKVWSGAGSGCSSFVGALSWQPKIGNCNKREVADVAAVADPNTGVAVYDSYGSTGGANWMVFGGTSVASPIIASVYALAGNAGGNAPAIKYGEYVYAHKAGNLNDVTSGSNGTCSTWYNKSSLALCTAAIGYDGPTGLGSPNGLGAF